MTWQAGMECKRFSTSDPRLNKMRPKFLAATSEVVTLLHLSCKSRVETNLCLTRPQALRNSNAEAR